MSGPSTAKRRDVVIAGLVYSLALHHRGHLAVRLRQAQAHVGASIDGVVADAVQGGRVSGILLSKRVTKGTVSDEAVAPAKVSFGMPFSNFSQRE